MVCRQAGILGLTKGRGADVVIEMVGHNQDTINTALDYVRQNTSAQRPICIFSRWVFDFHGRIKGLCLPWRFHRTGPCLYLALKAATRRCAIVCVLLSHHRRSAALGSSQPSVSPANAAYSCNPCGENPYCSCRLTRSGQRDVLIFAPTASPVFFENTKKSKPIS